jgi:hypothetical protein
LLKPKEIADSFGLPGVTHEFFGMDAVVAKAREAQDFAVSQLEKGFDNGTPGTVGAGAAKQ